LRLIIEDYAREAGVRNLENLIKKISRKAVMQIVRGASKNITVQKKEIESYLGKPVFAADEMFENIPGVVTGLAWTNMGGATLQIEATAVQSRNKGFKQTGQLGAVMVESADIAYSYVMAHLERFGAPPNFFDERFVHIHVPAGATPKDGPSAGITMATALVSMILKKPVRKRLAMTGELTLTGQVLPIGGLKEKIIAARRSGCKFLIFPESNRKDYDDLPDYLKKGFTVFFASNYGEVYSYAFNIRSSS
jgi:ATP-dependent Lon protease